ncbi:MAG TPA: carbohydrate porin [Planctomycetota bacterium]|nr:carbohydrate porin [Planctomycetota bacterium]
MRVRPDLIAIALVNAGIPMALVAQREQEPIAASGRATFEWTASGGSSHAAGRAEVELGFDFDLGRLLEARGLAARLAVRSYRGEPVASGGTLHGLSSIAQDEDVDRLSEAWLRLGDTRASLQAGILDANATFAALGEASGFLLASASTSPVLIGMPTFPDAAAGAEFAWRGEGIFLAAGAYLGLASDALEIAQGDEATAPSPREGRGWFAAETGIALPGAAGRLGIGAFHDTADHERFDGGTQRGASGLYALGECCLRHFDARSERGLHAFGFAGMTDGNVADVKAHAMLGFTCHGLLRTRAGDVVGLAWSRLDASSPAAGLAGDETALEAFWRLRLGAGSELQLSVQFVDAPGGDAAAEDAVVFGVRSTFAF